ncbi:MAG: GtrA family protein [Acutalibacteraceae bacterium]
MKRKGILWNCGIPAVIAVATDLLVFRLFSALSVAGWISAVCAWVAAVCAGFLVSFAFEGNFPCELDHVLNELTYCGLAGSPALALDLAVLLVGMHFWPVSAFLWKAVGAVLSAAAFFPCRRALQQPLKKLHVFLNEETISYLFFGILTTVVNIVIHWILSEKCGINPMVSNSIAWVGAVAFAYATNRRYVFKSRTTGAALWREIGLFLAARLLSLGVDEGGMALCLYVLHMDNMLSKVLMNVIVVILNYFASKWMIFGRKESRQ